MADAITQLPPGFVLDQPTAGGLPPGFVLDEPIAQPVQAVADQAVEVTATEEDPGFLSRVEEDLAARGQIMEEIQRATDAGEQSFGEGILQVLGKVGAGSVLDIIGEGLVSAVQGISAITPDEIEDPLIENATKAGLLFLDTDIGKAGLEAAQSGLASYNEFKSENPRAARNIEAVVDIGLLAAPIKGKPKVRSQPTAAGRAAEGLAARAETQTARQQTEFLDDLVRPKQTAAVRKEEIRRTAETGGVFGSRTVEPTAIERGMADAVGNVPGVSKSNTQLTNMNAISKEVRKESDSLSRALKKNDVIIPKREFTAELDNAIIRLAENPLIVGDAASTATKVVDKMKQIVASKPGTASGLLAARKELDAFIRTQRPKVFDPAQESALSTAVREVRQTTNNFIDARATNVAVKDSLRKQSTLLSAIDNIAPKAADEAGNAALRLFQGVARALPIKSETASQITLGLGLSSIPVVASVVPFIPQLAIGGLAAAGGISAVRAPATKKALSKLLSLTDRAIRTTKDEALIAQLRLDRGALVEILKQSEQ